eukprot:Hpha_TRINITY_DN27397_c0_g1::TRINITY_DN27397_c0_g1_i1::g.699::m.699
MAEMRGRRGDAVLESVLDSTSSRESPPRNIPGSRPAALACAAGGALLLIPLLAFAPRPHGRALLGTRVLLYPKSNCVGIPLQVEVDNDEALCRGCWDACSKELGGEAGPLMVAAVRVSGGTAVSFYGANCWGTFEYAADKADALLRVVYGTDGCVNFPPGARPTHFTF